MSLKTWGVFALLLGSACQEPALLIDARRSPADYDGQVIANVCHPPFTSCLGDHTVFKDKDDDPYQEIAIFFDSVPDLFALQIQQPAGECFRVPVQGLADVAPYRFELTISRASLNTHQCGVDKICQTPEPCVQ